MRVLATRRYPGPAFDEFDDVEVGSLAALDAPRPDVEGLAVSNEPVPLDLLPNLRIVANFGVGYDRIDVAARARGVVVTNTPGVLTDSTADLAMALIPRVRAARGRGRPPASGAGRVDRPLGAPQPRRARAARGR